MHGLLDWLTKLTTIVTDRELSLVIEERGTEDALSLGLATYSNSDSTVLSYPSIFENQWAQSTSKSPEYQTDLLNHGR
jgi:hypothetical protein